jgi:hypothetical protein
VSSFVSGLQDRPLSRRACRFSAKGIALWQLFLRKLAGRRNVPCILLTSHVITNLFAIREFERRLECWPDARSRA